MSYACDRCCGSLLWMASGADKKQLEREALLRFFDAKRLPVDRTSIEKLLGERQPDFCVLLGGEKVAFELTEVCAEEVAKLIAAPAGKEVPTWTGDPTMRIVWQKMHKIYNTTLPIELLCYWRGRVVSTDEMVLENMRRVVNSGPNPFRRVWYHGEHGVHSVW